METVVFVDCETGDDMEVSFAIADRNGEGVYTLTLLRSPELERPLAEDERGVSVSFDREDENEDDTNFLEEVAFSEAQGRLRLKTRRHSYDLDVRKVGEDELHQVREVLHKMNFDQRIRMSGFGGNEPQAPEQLFLR